MFFVPTYLKNPISLVIILQYLLIMKYDLNEGLFKKYIIESCLQYFQFKKNNFY